jgi:hypothetical protein
MMCDVAGGDVRERANRKWIAARDAAPRPRLMWHLGEQRERRRPHRAKLVDVAAQRTCIRRRSRNGDVLIEARKRAVEAACEPHRAKREHPLAVVDVARDLANGPFPRSIPMQ